MKKMLIGVGVLAAMALSSLVAVAGDEEKGTTIMNIHWVSYCDGAYFVINKVNGTVTGYQTGCMSDNIMGIKCIIPKQGNQAAIVFTTANDDLLWVLRWNHTWTIYNTSGGVVNSGTWANGSPTKDAGAGPAAGK
jgi:hypothetical protein